MDERTVVMSRGEGQPSLPLVSFGGHGLSTPILPCSTATCALMRSCFFACSASVDTGGQDGLRRDGRPSFAAHSTGIANRLQPAMRARPPLVPIRALVHRQVGGCKSIVVVVTPYAARALAGCLVVQRNSVPSIHMRCRTTASLRARATLASFTLLLFAIRIAQPRRPDRAR